MIPPEIDSSVFMLLFFLIWPGRCWENLWSEGPEDEVVADEEGGRDDVDDRPPRGGAEVERDGDESSQNGAGEQEFGSSDLIIRNPFKNDLVLLFKKNKWRWQNWRLSKDAGTAFLRK